MNIKHLLASAAAVALLSVAPLSAATLNPQPEPPGKTQVMGTAPHTATTLSGGNAAMGDDTYCGTPTPGHPHVSASCDRLNNSVHPMVGTATGGGGAGGAAMGDDTYCGTPTPGHPHAVACNTTNMTMHDTTIGSATSGAGSGRASDADDNYCGTAVPGHPHINSVQSNNMAAPGTASCANGSKVMLNPQPLPPGERTQGMTH
jgi:hypothetical protein